MLPDSLTSILASRFLFHLQAVADQSSGGLRRDVDGVEDNESEEGGMMEDTEWSDL